VKCRFGVEGKGGRGRKVFKNVAEEEEGEGETNT
jgi:hypothetical protein